MKNKIIFFDIETIADYNEIYHVINQEKYWEKMDLMPEFNKIFCISCWYIEESWDKKIVSYRETEWITEENIIRKFFDIIKWRKICWFNIKNFDIPFIVKRALKYWILIPDDLKQFWKKPREMENIIDLKDVYSYWVFWSFWNLDLCCKFLWITSPKEEWIDWSQVQKYFDEWRWDEIVQYCMRDVAATIQLYEYFKKSNLMD